MEDATALDATDVADATATDTAADAADTAVAADAACVPVDAATGVTFSTVWTTVMAPGHCSGSGCHDQGNASPQGLDMTTMDAARASLVGAPAMTATACRPTDVTLRVAPGDPDRSMLWRRVSGTTCAEQMPLGRAPLSCADQNLVRDWILSGAQ